MHFNLRGLQRAAIRTFGIRNPESGIRNRRRSLRSRPAALATHGLFILATIALAACATLPQGTPEEIVTERAKARWTALLAGDFETAYGYYSPGYRSGHSLEGFRIRMGASRVTWSDVQFDSIQCQTKLCRPVFFVNYSVTSPLPMVGKIESTTRVEEDWLLEDGHWWYRPEDGESR